MDPPLCTDPKLITLWSFLLHYVEVVLNVVEWGIILGLWSAGVMLMFMIVVGSYLFLPIIAERFEQCLGRVYCSIIDC